MAGTKGREAEFARWPKYKASYMRAFEQMLAECKKRGKTNKLINGQTTAKDVFNWWMEYDVLPGQIDLFEQEDEY